MVGTEAHTVCKRELRILLECFLVVFGVYRTKVMNEVFMELYSQRRKIRRILGTARTSTDTFLLSMFIGHS